MNIDKLIAAAKEIDALAEKADARTREWQLLASDARKPGVDRSEIERRKAELDAGRVVDYSSAIQRLRSALHDQ